jgi:hypothetical protein
VGYLVGTDEAGYAPNLGPLVISATVWSVPGDPTGVDLYRLLNKAVARSPAAHKGPPRRVVLADSKVVYKPPGGIADLELGVLAALGLAGVRPSTWRECWRLLDPASVAAIDALPWHASFQRDLPLAADTGHLERLGKKFCQQADRAGVRLLTVRSRAVFPDDWNRLTDEHNKSTALSLLTLELLSQVLAELGEQPVAVICDKHGGRNFYQPLLQRHVEHVVEIYGEGRNESVYRWGPAQRRTEVMFCVNAERYLPCALASMASKYLRELSMLAFNDYWRTHLPDLRPTAGYPLDAGRFRSDIATVQQSLGIEDRVLWRNR